MKKLPSEILGEIFLYLHPKDKIDCMLVCQHWKQIIEDVALFNTLDIRSKTSLRKVTAMVKKNPAIGKKVENLILFYAEKKGSSDLNRLLGLLPNIRTLLCKARKSESLIKNATIYPWSEHIEYINEFAFGSITASLLFSSICSKLTTLIVNDQECIILPLLKNAPALRKLRLTTISISFDGLETLHENTPCLESFTVDSLTLKKYELSCHIKPAISITECNFENVVVTSSNLEATKQLLTYASKKYPNLSSFKYTFDLEDQDDDYMKKITCSDWLPLLQNVGPKLKKLFASTNGWGDNAFDILDRCNCQIEHLKICGLTSATFTKIVQSQQIYYIQSLVVCTISFKTFGWLNELQTLKKLKLYGFRPNMELGIILDNSPPTLRSLSLCDVSFIADPEYIGLSNIECLSFDDVCLYEGIDAFISQHFPKLTKLKLKKCSMIGDTFNLEKMDLFNFTFQAAFSEHDFEDLLIVTYNNNEHRSYSLECDVNYSYEIDNQDCTIYPAIKSQIPIEADIGVDLFFDLTFHCNSLKNFILT